MSTDKLLTINEFAEIARTTRNTLRWYDEVGVFSPVKRGENNYRYYVREQLSVLNMIYTLQELGMTLTEIKELVDYRTPKMVMDLFEQRTELIDVKIKEWMDVKKLLLTIKDAIQSGLNINEDEITVQWQKEEKIILGEVNDYSKGKDDHDAWHKFYRTAKAKYKDLSLSYPVWSTFTKERIEKKDWKWPSRYYFYNPNGHDCKPAGLYVVGYMRGWYGQTDKLYQRLVNYIESNKLEIDGDAYEEYPLNELSVADENSYLIRVMIKVRESA